VGARLRLKRTLGGPARQFFDRRFEDLDASVRRAMASTHTAVERDLRGAVDMLSRRIDRLAHDLSTVSRAQSESMTYVARELRALDERTEVESARLRAVIGEASHGAAERVAETYTGRALADLSGGAAVLTLGFEESPLPFALAELGFEVTMVGRRAYPFEHPRLQSRIGAPADVRERFAAVVWTVSGSVGRDIMNSTDLLARAGSLVEPGGVVVLEGPASLDEPASMNGLEVIDRVLGARLLLTARRA
jgi:hypothetical protein